MTEGVSKKIISNLPYSEPFLFVDRITDVSDKKICGEYQFKKDEYFYKGHFKDKPVTPGVILLETMGQIGLVCFIIYLNDFLLPGFPLLSNIDTDFYKTVNPGEKVFVSSEKQYFRNNILKCNILMHDKYNALICSLKAILKFNNE